MKKTFTPIISILILSVLISCKNEKSYSELQEKEIITIKNYIQQNSIQIVKEKPNDGGWGTNVYYQTASGLYIHLVNIGDKSDSLAVNSIVGYRFIEYALDINKTVRLKNWEPREFIEPVTFTYGSSNATTNIGLGIHEAIGLMKYRNSEAKIIVPAVLNTGNYTQYVTPVVYDIKITVIK